MDAIRKWTIWLGGLLLAIYAVSEDPIRDEMGDLAKAARERIEDSVGNGFELIGESFGELEWTS